MCYTVSNSLIRGERIPSICFPIHDERWQSGQWEEAVLQNYRNFDLLVTKSGTEYQARVVESPAGNAVITFAAPFSDLDLQGIALAMKEARGGVSGKQAVQRFGEQLFASVFTGLVGEIFHRSRDIARDDACGLRLRLRLTEVPELAIGPWEYLYDPVLG